MTNIDYIETLFPVQAADCVYMERAFFFGELILASKWLDLLRCASRHQVELSKIKSYGPGPWIPDQSEETDLQIKSIDKKPFWLVKIARIKNRFAKVSGKKKCCKGLFEKNPAKKKSENIYGSF